MWQGHNLLLYACCPDTAGIRPYDTTTLKNRIAAVIAWFNHFLERRIN